MKKRSIQTAIAAGAAAGLLILLFFAVKTKKLRINTWIVSDRDTIGVDLSEYQADVDMPGLKEQGIEFVYMKATEGSGHVDSRFAENWENARECGLPAGAYHFFSFDSAGEMQAQNYINTVGALEGKLIPAVDVEYYGNKKDNPPDKEDVVRELSAFIQALEKEYHVRPTRWVRSIYYPAIFEAGSSWIVWQYCDTAQLEGYEGGERFIDLDVLRRGRSLQELMVGRE